MGTGLGFFLIASGAVLLFAVPGDWPSGLNLHVVGVIAMVTGVLRLLLLPVLGAAPSADRLRRWVNPSGTDAPGVHDVQRAAAIDVAQIREDESLFSPSSPGSQQDEL